MDFNGFRQLATMIQIVIISYVTGGNRETTRAQPSQEFSLKHEYCASLNELARASCTVNDCNFVPEEMIEVSLGSLFITTV